ncbi:MAG: TspO/MBR family protein [Bdellovibrionales bacterium]
MSIVVHNFYFQKRGVQIKKNPNYILQIQNPSYTWGAFPSTLNFVFMFDQIDLVVLALFIAFWFWGIDDRENTKIRDMFDSPDDHGADVVLVGESVTESIRKPRLQPPPWVFGVVWPILYITSAVSGFLFWQQDTGFWYFFGMSCYAAARIINRYWTRCFVAGWFALAAWMIVAMQVLGGLYLAAGFVLVSDAVAWVGLALYIPLLVWQTFALYLNVKVIRNKRRFVSMDDFMQPNVAF